MKKAMKWNEFSDKLKFILSIEESDAIFGSKEINENKVVRLKNAIAFSFVLPNIIVNFKDTNQSFILREDGKDKFDFKRLLNKKIYDLDFDFLKSGKLVVTLEMYFWR